MFHCVHQTQDGGYIVSGVSETINNYYPVLMKFDINGDEEWNWTIQHITYENLMFEIIDVYPIFSNQISNGGYLFCLWLDINHLDEMITIAGLFKFNEYGQQEWINFYSDGFDWIFRPISFIEIENGFVIAGTSGNPSSYMGDIAGLLKTDNMGNMEWYKEYNSGQSDNNRMESIYRTNDNGFIITGWRNDNSIDYWMIKTDEFGNKLWEVTFGGNGDDYGHSKSSFQTIDDGYLMCGFSSSFGSGGFDVWVIKTDSNGNMIWNKTYGSMDNDVCWSITSTDDGGFVSVVTMNYGGFSGDKDDIHLVKFDINGNIEWIREHGGPGIQIGGFVDYTVDGGFIVSGCTGSFHSSRSDGLLVKFAQFDNERPNKPDKPSGKKRGNPNTEYTFSTNAVSDPDGNTVMYKWDWGDGNFSELLGSTEASYSWSYEDNFEIRVMAVDEHGGESDWSDPLPFSTPKNKITISLMLERLLYRIPILKLLI
jgi:hypothetical protein